MTTPTMLALTLLADEPANTGPDFGKASPVGLLVVVLLLIGTFLLVWSMNRQLNKLPASFDHDDTAAAPDEDASRDEGSDDKASDDEASDGEASDNEGSTGGEPDEPTRGQGGQQTG